MKRNKEKTYTKSLLVGSFQLKKVEIKTGFIQNKEMQGLLFIFKRQSAENRKQGIYVFLFQIYEIKF